MSKGNNDFEGREGRGRLNVRLCTRRERGRGSVPITRVFFFCKSRWDLGDYRSSSHSSSTCRIETPSAPDDRLEGGLDASVMASRAKDPAAL